MFAASPTAYDAGRAVDRQVALDVDAPAAPQRQPGRRRQRRPHDPAAPDDAVAPDRRAVGEGDVPRPDLGHRDAHVQADALAAEHLAHVVVRAVGERGEQRVAEVDDVHLRRRHREVAELRGQRVVDHVRQRARDLDTGGAATHDDEVQRAALKQGGVAVGVLEDAEDLGAQPRRVVQRVERQRVLRRTGRAEEFGCDPAARTTASPAYARPSAVVTSSAAGSRPVTSSSLTSTFGRWRKILRSEDATSAGASWQVATWYRSGWNWW